ncbi:peptidylprolyl isomerase [Curvibacter sp. APW13]|uniref:peptidylprolyl isomerase n=1 Tax=Curvibacter sp. APW13 TaxID=3077236 RepID=UPI0028DD47FE|nr:peptidylprolyl isomerase [Curvibacter sp. APW13]MDT8991422.1 peptidylprolyl isomerase [Curvibacter sp. APW13]
MRRNKFIVALAAFAASISFTLNTQAADKAPSVLVKTNMGEFTVALNAEKAPITVKNFLQYVADKQYDGTIFHRVIENFMVQGGGFTPEMQEKATRPPIPLEASNGLKNNRGTIAMARTANPNSATAQFYINVVDNPALNAPSPDGYGYTVFGAVTKGMETIDKIRKVPTGMRNGYSDVPQTPVTILSITLLK